MKRDLRLFGRNGECVHVEPWPGSNAPDVIVHCGLAFVFSETQPTPHRALIYRPATMIVLDGEGSHG